MHERVDLAAPVYRSIYLWYVITQTASGSERNLSPIKEIGSEIWAERPVCSD